MDGWICFLFRVREGVVVWGTKEGGREWFMDGRKKRKREIGTRGIGDAEKNRIVKRPRGTRCHEEDFTSLQKKKHLLLLEDVLKSPR